MWILGLKGLMIGMMCSNVRFVKDVQCKTKGRGLFIFGVYLRLKYTDG